MLPMSNTFTLVDKAYDSFQHIYLYTTIYKFIRVL